MSYVWVAVAFALIGATHCFGQLLWLKCKKRYY